MSYSVDILASEGVERADPQGPPTAFRIWLFGENMTDHGLVLFTERSAVALSEAQDARGNLYPIDVNHMSLDMHTPIENQRAVGWHRLEVREDGLWAIEVTWDPMIAKGLTAEPPAWRYFSPAYDVDEMTQEVVKYLNSALTNLPATWNVTALATAHIRREDMTKKEIFAALRKFSETDTESDAGKLIAALMAMEDVKKLEDEEPNEPKPDGDEGKEEEEVEDKAKSKTSSVDESATIKDMAETIQKIQAELISEREAAERAKLMSARPDLQKPVQDWLKRAPIATVRDAVKTLPRVVVTPTTETVQATRSAGGTANHRDAQLPLEQYRELQERMGLETKQEMFHWDPNRRNTRIFPILTPEQASAYLSKKVAK